MMERFGYKIIQFEDLNDAIFENVRVMTICYNYNLRQNLDNI